MRVYFDASVLITAILSPNGGSAQLLKFIKKDPIVGIASQTVIEEVLEEDHLQKIKRSKWEIEKFIAQSGLIVRKKITGDETAVYENLVAENDSHLIAGANITKCQYLVTLDKKHLLRPDIKERFLPLCIVSPKELLEDVVTK
jgi:putative PIN family toxin of toxin-antitoxin system